MNPETRFAEVAGRRLEYRIHPAHQVDRPTLVLLHEGLGSVAMWRDFPAQVAQTTGCRTLVYSRQGYGLSDPAEGPRTPEYMHREALVFLPALLDQLGIENPVLVGHSDGASIALIHAGASGRPCAGVVVMAPHCFVEEVTLTGIRAAQEVWESTDLPARLAKHHRDAATAAAAWRAWQDIWLAAEFRDWNIEDVLPGMRCPILAIQGVDDEYGTLDQIDAIARGALNSPDVGLLKLADCRHSPHKDQARVVVDALLRFVDGLPLRT